MPHTLVLCSHDSQSRCKVWTMTAIPARPTRRMSWLCMPEHATWPADKHGVSQHPVLLAVMCDITLPTIADTTGSNPFL